MSIYCLAFHTPDTSKVTLAVFFYLHWMHWCNQCSIYSFFLLAYISLCTGLHCTGFRLLKCHSSCFVFLLALATMVRPVHHMFLLFLLAYSSSITLQWPTLVFTHCTSSGKNNVSTVRTVFHQRNRNRALLKCIPTALITPQE